MGRSKSVLRTEDSEILSGGSCDSDGMCGRRRGSLHPRKARKIFLNILSAAKDPTTLSKFGQCASHLGVKNELMMEYTSMLVNQCLD